MSILINKDTKVITQGITGKTGQFHTKMGKEYANGKNCYVAGVTPKKGGQSYDGIPIYDTVKEAKAATGATVSVIYVPPAICGCCNRRSGGSRARTGDLHHRRHTGARHGQGQIQTCRAARPCWSAPTAPA